MDKLFKTVIGLGFLIVIAGGILYVAGQMIGLVIGQPEIVILMENTITKVIFPAAALSGLLCFIYYYVFPKKKSGK